MSGIRDAMRDHVLALAARYNDAAAEERGLQQSVEDIGLTLDDVMYIAEQRALRVVAIFSSRPMLKELLLGNTNKPVVVPPLTNYEHQVFEIAKVSCLDGICIGYKAHQIKEADNE